METPEDQRGWLSRFPASTAGRFPLIPGLYSPLTHHVEVKSSGSWRFSKRARLQTLQSAFEFVQRVKAVTHLSRSLERGRERISHESSASGIAPDLTEFRMRELQVLNHSLCFTEWIVEVRHRERYSPISSSQTCVSPELSLRTRRTRNWVNGGNITSCSSGPNSDRPSTERPAFACT